MFFFVTEQGADPGIFLGGVAPLRNGVTDWWPDVLQTDFNSEYEEEGRSSQGGGGGGGVAHFLHPPPRSAPVNSLSSKVCARIFIVDTGVVRN